MNVPANITPESRKEDSITVVDLKVAPENPRSDETVDVDQIQELAQSILENGLLTPLIGYWQNDLFYVTAGGRRVRALHWLLEMGSLPGNNLFPAIVMDRTSAIHAGRAEQMAHVAMDEQDELRLFEDPAYANLTDAQLAARLGRSVRYIGQRREIMRLPEPMVVDVLNRNLSMDQAIGLTYAKLYPETQADFYQRAIKDHRFGSSAMRNALANTIRPWTSFCHAQLVTRDDYIAAGGKLQEDLFTGDPMVLDPQILLQLATERAREVMKERFPDALFITEADEDTRLYDIPTHKGVWGLDEHESREWREDLSWWAINRLEKQANANDEDPDYDEAAAMTAQAELDKLLARKAELEPRATYLYPEALAELLGVAWKLAEGPMFDRQGDLRDPLSIREHVLPTGWSDIEKLTERGFLEKPAKKEPEKEVALEDRISAAHAMRIERVRTHALRMELSKSTDEVLKLFAIHLAGKLGRSVCFSIDPEQTAQPDPEMTVTWSSQWQKLEELGKANGDGVRGFNAKEIRDLLAYRILMCLTLRNPQAKDLDSATIRRWWTPDAGFLSAYSKPQLLAMLKTVKPDDDFSKEKRGPLAEILERLVAQDKTFLPFGF